MDLTYNDSINIFVDVAHHLELEQDRTEVVGPMTNMYIASSNSQGASGFKHKKYGGF